MALCNRRLACALAALALAAAPLSAQTVSAQSRRVVLPEGAVIPVRLDTALSSKYNRPGDRFTATVRSGYDDAGMPAGTRVEGVVREALPAGNGKPGVLDLDFTRIVFPGGDSRTMTASLISLDNKSVRRSDAGHLVASSDKSQDRLKFIGIGAGAGLLIGTLTKQNTFTSLLLGAGAGYLFNELGNKKPGDVNLKEGAEFGVRFDRQFAFNGDHYPIRTDYPGYSGTGYSGTGNSGDDRYYHRSDSNLPQPAHRYDNDRYNNNGNIGVLLDDRNVDFGSVRPIMRGTNVLIPLKALSRAAGFRYDYDPDTQTIRVHNSTEMRLAVGSRIAMINGERRRMDVAAEERNGTMYVPMQFAAMAVDGSAYWDAATRTVVITTHNHYR